MPAGETVSWFALQKQPRQGRGLAVLAALIAQAHEVIE